MQMKCKLVDWTGKETLVDLSTENTAHGTTNQISESAVRDAVSRTVIQ